MRIRMFAILDSAVEAYNTPFTARTVQEALRMFALACSKEGQFQTNPRDFVLYEIGSYDDSSGMLEPQEPRRLISAAECIQAAKDSPGDFTIGGR